MTQRMRESLPTRVAPGLGLVVVALVVVYVVWGSTYLAIRVVVQEAPPLQSMGIRYLCAALVLGSVLAVRGGVRRLHVSRGELLGAAFLGLMLPVLGNGLVSVGEDLGAPSGITALLIAITPLTIMVYRTLAGDRPRLLTMVGVLLGFAGLGYLVLTGRGQDTGEVPILAAGLIVLASACWGFGSWVQPRLRLPKDAFVTTFYEMLAGGLILLGAGTAAGERFTPASYGPHTWLALGYLVVFGSMLAFTAYVWLLSHAPVSLVATYAYVNPVVAVLLGWLILSEPITGAVVVGGGIVVAAVAMVITAERPRRKPLPEAVDPLGAARPAARPPSDVIPPGRQSDRNV
jgi:drug/metabolite transporter (DMT)-like permease